MHAFSQVARNYLIPTSLVAHWWVADGEVKGLEVSRRKVAQTYAVHNPEIDIHHDGADTEVEVAVPKLIHSLGDPLIHRPPDLALACDHLVCGTDSRAFSRIYIGLVAV